MSARYIRGYPAPGYDSQRRSRPAALLVGIMKHFFAPLLALLFSLPSVRGAEALVWSFEDDLLGWGPTNWESTRVERGIHGVSRYDCQLLSPVLDIRAEDYPEMVVGISSDTQGHGELFFCNTGEGLSDAKKAQHTLTGDGRFRDLRIPLHKEDEWSGTIHRVRFDPLNPAGAHVTVRFIALLPRAGEQLLNGGAEILTDGRPHGWTSGPDTVRATATAEAPHNGRQCLHARDGGWWETLDIDLSFLGVFEVTGHVRTGAGGTIEAVTAFAGTGGERLSARKRRLAPEGPGWQPFRFTFEAPSRASTARVRFVAPPGNADGFHLDDVAVTQISRGSIVTMPPPQPTWDAEWIWHPDALKADDCHAYFRHRFSLPARALASARLQITADDHYVLRVNGHEYSPDSAPDGWRTPEAIDLKPWLRAGADNEVYVDARDAKSAQGLIVEGLIVFADGQRQELSTGAHWEAALQPDGPWGKAVTQGKPPCLPWGYLPWQPLGPLPGVAVRMEAALPQGPGTRQARLKLTATAEDDIVRPVFVTVVLTQGANTLARLWAPRPLFEAGARAGESTTLEEWDVRIPTNAAPGPVRFSLEPHGAAWHADPEPVELVVRPPPPSNGFPEAEIRRDGDILRLFVNGREVDPTQALFNRPDDLQQRHAAAARIPVWSVALDAMGFKEDGYDFGEVDSLLDQYLDAKPDAWLIPTFTFDTRYQTWWIEAHPEARCRLEDGGDVIGDYHGGRRRVPSYGSSVWRDAYTDALRHLIRHLRQSRFGPRIIGFQPCFGISWEWFHWGSQSGELVDYSDAGQADFRRWLGQAYGTDSALRDAWHDQDVTLASAGVPANAERRTPKDGQFYGPSAQRNVLDYHRYQHDVVADTIRHFGRVVKEETGGRSLFGTYYGYVTHLPETPGFCQSSGHFSLYRVLASPEVDYCMAPVAYAWREVGGTGACMTAAGSFPLNGKLFWNQADLRSHWSPQAGFGKPSDVLGSIQCMRREAARSLAEGTAIQWYDFSLGWTFGDERLTDEAARLLVLNRQRTEAKSWPLSDYLAVIVDERQMGTFDLFRPTYGLYLIYRQREALIRSGVPWQAYLFSDLLARPELLQHRAFLFLNLFRLDGQEREFLRGRVMADGRTAAFVGPAGLLTQEGLSPESASRLLGWPVALEAEPAPLQARMLDSPPKPWAPCAGQTFGPSAEYKPRLVPGAGAQGVLARFVKNDAPALLAQDREACKAVWSAAPGLTPEMIRSLATLAGVPVVSSSNAAIFAGRGFVGIHAKSHGSHQVRLPRPGPARELLTNQEWPKGTTEIRLELEAGDTAILMCPK